MNLSYRILPVLLLFILLIQGCANKTEFPVSVTISSGNNTITSEVDIVTGNKGQKYINISLTNNGAATDKITSIEVTVKPKAAVSKETKLMYGGTCMGRTPLQQSNAADLESKSGTFMMLKHNESSYAHVGVLTWHTFLPYLQYILNKGIIITANGENKTIEPGETIKFEKLLITEGSSWQDLMFNHGKEIAAEHKRKAKQPLQLKGWSTWDYYGKIYDTKDVIKNIDQLSADGFNANLIQIDGGWWTTRGDYLSVRDNLQGGMKAIADYAKSKGYKPGIHLDGFRADKSSDVYKEHPDWFLKDQDGETIYQPNGKGDRFLQHIYFDYSNPEVCEYIKNTLTTMREDWGFQYFKIDFIRYGLLESIMHVHGNKEKKGVKYITEVNAHNNSMTSVERTRAGLLAMREGIGDAFFLGCSSIFGPTLGIVDGLRTGGDISPIFDFYETRCLQNGGNFYLNHSVTQTDADYLVLRNKHDEEPERVQAWRNHKYGGNITLDEAKMWSDYVALYGGIKINSDNLLTLRDERKNLIENAFALKTATRFIPIDLWEHANDKNDAFNIMLAENEDGVYLSLFNWDKTDKEIELEGFSKTTLTNTHNGESHELNDGKFSTTLKSHTSLILKIEQGNFDELRELIQYNL